MRATKEEKKAGRDLARRGGPYSVAECLELLDDRATDVDPLGAAGPLAARCAGAPEGLERCTVAGTCALSPVCNRPGFR